MNKRLLHPSSVLALAFLSAIAIGTLLLMLPLSQAQGEGAPWLAALFTATSAVCVTGLAVVDTGSYWSSFGQWVILGLFQLGGFGMMTSATLLGVLVNRQLGLRSRILLQAETHSLALGDVRSVARVVLAVTVSVEAVMALLLALRLGLGYGMPWREALWQGLFHSVSAFNNAGFSTWGDSVMRFVGDAMVLGPLALAIVIGGLGFPVLHEIQMRLRWRRSQALLAARALPAPRRHQVRKLFSRTHHDAGLQSRPVASIHMVLTLWGTAFLLVFGTLVLLLAEFDNPGTLGPLGWPQKVMAALFTSVSARTAGFNAIDIGKLSVESLNLHYLLMFIGGGSAGTAGGVKITTFFVLMLVVWNEVRGHQDVEFRSRRISTQSQRQALAILVLSAGAVVIATLALVPMTTLAYEKVLFEVISAFATVGLSTGITAQLPPAGQLILIVLMFVGRVGVVTLAAAMAASHNRRAYRYPEEKPIVG